MEESKDSGSFEKSLNLFDAIAIVSGAMIGSGIFIVSSSILKEVQSPWLLLLVWGIAAVMTISGALCYGEYAASVPEAGGQYVYIKKIWGQIPGFLYGWTLFLIIQTGNMAAVSIAFAKFLGLLVPAISASNHVLEIGKFAISTQQCFALAIIALLTFINTRGAKSGAMVQNIFTTTKIVALLGVIILGLTMGMKTGIIHANFSTPVDFSGLHMSLFSLIAVSLVGALFASDSWNNVTFIASEIKNPEKNLPLALLGGTGLVLALYILTNLVYLFVLPVKGIIGAPEGIVGSALVAAILGNPGKILICIIIMISAFGCLNGMIMAGSRVFYAMAKDGLFFEKLAKLGKKSHVPENALWLQGAWGGVLVLSGSLSQMFGYPIFDALLSYTIFASLLFYILTIGGLFKFRKNFPDIPRPYKTVLYPFMPILYCTLAAIISVNLLIYQPVTTWPSLILVLSGLPVYYVWSYIKSKKAATAEITETQEETPELVESTEI